MSRKTGVVKDGKYMQHSMGFAHPESPERLAVIYEMLENPLMSWKFTPIEPREATHEEIERIHARSYVDFIASTAGKRSVFLDPDTSTSPETYDAAKPVSYTHLRAHETVLDLVCRLLLEKKKQSPNTPLQPMK